MIKYIQLASLRTGLLDCTQSLRAGNNPHSSPTIAMAVLSCRENMIIDRFIALMISSILIDPHHHHHPPHHPYPHHPHHRPNHHQEGLALPLQVR